MKKVLTPRAAPAGPGRKGLLTGFLYTTPASAQRVRGRPGRTNPPHPGRAHLTPQGEEAAPPRSYVAAATTSSLQGTVDMTTITPSFQEDVGYGRTTCHRCPEG